MEFRDTLLAAQRNQQHKSSERYYKARFDPPKKEREAKPKDKLSANIQKFLAKRDEEERQKQLEAKRKRDELLSMRDPKALRKIQKTLKVIKSANKSVLADAVDKVNTAVTLDGPSQPDQDDYGYESQEAAAIYQKMMEKYSKIPDEPKFPVSNKSGSKKDIAGTRERVKHALEHEDDPQPHKRRRRTNHQDDRELSPPPKEELEKKKDQKPKPKRPMPPPMDFTQLLKLAEQKKSEPLEIVQKKPVAENEPERPMTKKQRKEYEEEVARKMRRQQEMQQRSAGKKVGKDMKPSQDVPKKPDSLNRIPKLGESKQPIDKQRNEREKQIMEREKQIMEREKQIMERERRQKDREDMDRARIANKEKTLDRDGTTSKVKTYEKIDRERLMKMKQESNQKYLSNDKSYSHKVGDRSRDSINVARDKPVKQNIDIKSQNTFRIDRDSNDKKFAIPNKNQNAKYMNGHTSQSKPGYSSQQHNDARDKVASNKPNNISQRLNGSSTKLEQNKHRLEQNKQPQKRPDERKPTLPNGKRIEPSGSTKPKEVSAFDFDTYMKSLKAKKPDGPRHKQMMEMAKRKAMQKRRALDSEDDSDMDDFIDDGDEHMDYSTHIKEIFGYDKSKYRDDDDDPNMESTFAQQMREEYVSKKIGIMEDLEDMRMEAMEKKMKSKKKRRIDDD